GVNQYVLISAIDCIHVAIFVMTELNAKFSAADQVNAFRYSHCAFTPIHGPWYTVSPVNNKTPRLELLHPRAPIPPWSALGRWSRDRRRCLECLSAVAACLHRFRKVRRGECPTTPFVCLPDRPAR